MASSSACTCSSVDSSAIRATPLIPKAPSCAADRSRRIGSQISASGRENANPAGITPTISALAPSMSATLPITPGSPPNRDCHKPSLSTTTGAAPARPSSGRNARPMRGGVRITSKNDAETLAACTRCGLSGPVKLACPSRITATLSSVRLSAA